MVRVISAMDGEHHIDVEEKHALLPPRVEVDALVEGLVQCPVGPQVYAWAWPATAGERRDREPWCGLGIRRQFTAQRVLDERAECLTPLLRATLGRG